MRTGGDSVLLTDDSTAIIEFGHAATVVDECEKLVTICKANFFVVHFRMFLKWTLACSSNDPLN